MEGVLVLLLPGALVVAFIIVALALAYGVQWLADYFRELL